MEDSSNAFSVEVVVKPAADVAEGSLKGAGKAKASPALHFFSCISLNLTSHSCAASKYHSVKYVQCCTAL